MSAPADNEPFADQAAQLCTICSQVLGRVRSQANNQDISCWVGMTSIVNSVAQSAAACCVLQAEQLELQAAIASEEQEVAALQAQVQLRLVPAYSKTT